LPGASLLLAYKSLPGASSPPLTRPLLAQYSGIARPAIVQFPRFLWGQLVRDPVQLACSSRRCTASGRAKIRRASSRMSSAVKPNGCPASAASCRICCQSRRSSRRLWSCMIVPPSRYDRIATPPSCRMHPMSSSPLTPAAGIAKKCLLSSSRPSTCTPYSWAVSATMARV
jgi:hypothetical protein